ncbi:MAG: lysophospholipid acyltransferase family protein [Myxococcota bacterium]|nr:lysophospholipid acyltransferase family protein [Myxococcota bacterium]
MLFASLVSAVLWCASITLFVCLGSVYVLVGLLASPRALHPIARWACRALLLSAGQVLRVQGSFPPVKDGPYLYLFNHTSLLDTFVAIAVIPEFTGAVGKKEQFEVPIWGRILRHWGAVPIDRSDRSDAIERLADVGRAVADGQSLLVAPEGTRSPDGTLGPFKKGPFHVAVQQQATVVPIVISGAFQAKRKDSWLLRPGRITVRVGAALVTRDRPGCTVEDLQQEARGVFVEQLS